MSKSRSYRYLNKDTGLMYSPLYQAINEGQNRAPANQWPNIIKSLSRKGVKESEVADSNILEHLASLDGPVTKAELLNYLNDNAPLIKEIDLAQHRYKRWSYASSGKDYNETLYILASESDYLNDILLDIEYELDDLDFYPERLIENPLLAHELYEREQDIREQIAALSQESRTSVAHWSGQKDPDTGEEIKSLLFHTRTSIQEDGKTFFVEELQSDWAQRGRQNNWQSVPRAPWITNTDLWTGLAFRRLIQRAADNPNIDKFTWITGDYRNGGNFVVDDGLNDYYIKVVGKLVTQALKGTGEKPTFQKMRLGNKEVELPSFAMTDKVREKFKNAQPLYSRDKLRESLTQTELRAELPVLQQAIKSAQHMVGSSAKIRLLSHIVDHNGEAVSGRFLADAIDVSLMGQNPARALSHECWHYAHEHLLTPTEKKVADNAFLDDGLLERLTLAMKKAGLSQAAIEQCSDPKEAIAHAFSLWVQGQFELGSNIPIEKTFTKVDDTFEGLKDQVQVIYSYENLEQPLNDAELELLTLFEAFIKGNIAQRNADFETPR